MTTLQISGGSDKQNAWASQIAADWLKEMDAEITVTEARAESDQLGWYADNLRTARANLVNGCEKVTAKQVIDMHSAKRSPVAALINKARAK